MRRRLRFNLRYLIGRPLWDSGISPPELMSFIDAHPPGRAIDLGCGTGTNVLTLAQKGWEATGIDFSPLAIRRARRKIARAGAKADLRVGDVTNLSDVEGFFDLALDLGCFHGLPPADQSRYVSAIGDKLSAGATYLLYSFLRGGPADRPGLFDEAGLRAKFEGPFELKGLEHGYFKEQPSAWFTFVRRS